MNFDYTLEVLKHELVNQEYKRDYPSMIAVSMSEGFEKRIKELELVIELLENTQKLNYKHILEVMGIIQNDCTIIDSDEDVSISELRICIAHIAGLCNGLTRVINYKRTLV